MDEGTAVAITGLGIVSCLGFTLDEVSRGLQDGRSGIVVDPVRLELGFRSALTGTVPDFDAKRWGVNRKQAKTMSEPALYAFAAATDAVRDAGLEGSDLESERCGIIFGNDSTVRSSVESIDALRDTGDTRFLGSGYIFQSMNSTVTMNVATYFGIRGANWTVSAACASGANAIGQAAMLIRSGMQDVVLAGGAQEINAECMASFDALGAFSVRHDAPTKASRPFDADCDGLTPSGGSACLVLERYDRARARNARIYGVIRGYGFSSDGTGHLSKPSGEGAVRAMKMALDDAKVDPSEVTYVNAHATSTPLGDAVEGAAIGALLGDEVPVSSTKSMTGHECWMAGASEAVYTTLMARDGFLAPNLNFSKRHPECPPIDIVRETRAAPGGLAMSNSFGFGGTNAVLVIDYRGHL